MAEGKTAAIKHNWAAIFWGIVAAICFLWALVVSIDAEEVHSLGEVSTITIADGAEVDYVYINFSAPVYEDVASSQATGTFYSHISEEEFLKLLDENGIVIAVPFDAQSGPSQAEPMYRVIGENFWVKVVNPEETETPAT